MLEITGDQIILKTSLLSKKTSISASDIIKIDYDSLAGEPYKLTFKLKNSTAVEFMPSSIYREKFEDVFLINKKPHAPERH